MSDAPEDLRYTKEHEWVRTEEDGLLVVGITDHAQESLGDITFVDLPQAGNRFEIGQVFGVVESVKAASDVYLPLSGTIVEKNEALEDTPELVNSDPYGDGWLFRFKPDTLAQLEELLGSDDYERFIAELND